MYTSSTFLISSLSFLEPGLDGHGQQIADRSGHRREKTLFIHDLVGAFVAVDVVVLK